MSPLGIVALIAGVGVIGYVGYDIYKTSSQSPLQKLTKAVSNPTTLAAFFGITGTNQKVFNDTTSAEASSAEKYWNDFTSIF